MARPVDGKMDSKAGSATGGCSASATEPGGRGVETGAMPPADGAGPSGWERNISFANRISQAMSGKPDAPVSSIGVAVGMVLAEFDVLQHRHGVVGQHRERAVQRDQIGRDRLAVDAHEADGEAGTLLARQVRLIQADHALAGFT